MTLVLTKMRSGGPDTKSDKELSLVAEGCQQTVLRSAVADNGDPPRRTARGGGAPPGAGASAPWLFDQ